MDVVLANVHTQNSFAGGFLFVHKHVLFSKKVLLDSCARVLLCPMIKT